MEFLEALIVVAIPLAIVGAIFCWVKLGNWIIAPIHIAAYRATGRPRYSISDFVFLLMLLQIGFVVSLLLTPRPNEIYIAVCALALIVLWWIGIRKLSRADVTCRRRRGVFLIVIFPVATIGTLIGVSACFLLIFAIPFAAIPFAVILCGVFACCRQLADWVTQSSVAGIRFLD